MHAKVVSSKGAHPNESCSRFDNLYRIHFPSEIKCRLIPAHQVGLSAGQCDLLPTEPLEAKPVYAKPVDQMVWQGEISIILYPAGR